MRRMALAMATVALTVVAGIGSASAQTTIESVATALRRDPVYVDPAAERPISPVEAGRLRDQIRASGQPMFVAVLPAATLTQASVSASSAPAALARAVGLGGTYAVVAGNSFRATSTVLPSSTAAGLATAAFQANSSNGTAAVLDDFVTRVSQAAAAQASSPQAPSPQAGPTPATPALEPSRSSGRNTGLLIALGVLAALAVGAVVMVRRQGRQRRATVDETRAGLRAQAQALADDVVAVEPQLALHPDARPDFETAVSRYRAAEGALEQVATPAGAAQLSRLLEEGRYSMSRARARVEGREPPPPPPDLATPGPGGEPALVLNDQGEPDYQGHAGRWHQGSWVPGAAGGLLGGLLLGRMFGGGWGWGGGGWGWGGGWGDDDRGDWSGGGDDGGGWGGGDVGGGDWGGGGGDWGGGGGDWGGGGGGGDVGGGDWG